MKVLCLGGAGKISRESVYDLVEFSDFQRITIADCNEQASREVMLWLNDSRVDFKKVNVSDKDETVKLMRNYDIVMDGTSISLNYRSTACIAEAGVHGINLNGCSAEWDFNQQLKDKGICVPGFGMIPGITNIMAKHVADQLDTVDTIRISHGAFRPIAFSAAIAKTTRYEYGEFIQVPPFARPRDIDLPQPFGTRTHYIIPHAETKTLATSLANKGVRLIEVRGTWPAGTWN